MMLAGLALLLLSAPVALRVFQIYRAGDTPTGGITLLLGITSFFGLQFLMMGIVGEYLYRIYAEVVRRPLYFVSASTSDPDRRRPHGR